MLRELTLLFAMVELRNGVVLEENICEEPNTGDVDTVDATKVATSMVESLCRTGFTDNDVVPT